MDAAECKFKTIVASLVSVLFVAPECLMKADGMHLQGMTTSAQKINRKGILEKYKKGVDEALGK